jgi:hypothetical protein
MCELHMCGTDTEPVPLDFLPKCDSTFVAVPSRDPLMTQILDQRSAVAALGSVEAPLLQMWNHAYAGSTKDVKHHFRKFRITYLWEVQGNRLSISAAHVQFTHLWEVPVK